MFLDGESVPEHLDEREISILRLLRENPHASNREISERLSLSISQVITSIKGIEQRNCAHVLAILDAGKFGFHFAAALLKVRGRGVEDVARDVASIRPIQYAAAISGGPHDLLVFLRYRSIEELAEILQRRIGVVPGIDHCDTMVALDTLSFRIDYINYVPAFFPLDREQNVRDLEEEVEAHMLDELDRIIIAELQTNGRRTSQAIARANDVNAGTIRYRIRNLEAKGLMRFITVLEPGYLGLSAIGFLMIEVKAPFLQSACEALREQPWLPYLFTSTGDASIMGIIVGRDLQHLHELKAAHISSINGVRDVRIMQMIHNYKVDVRWGVA